MRPIRVLSGHNLRGTPPSIQLGAGVMQKEDFDLALVEPTLFCAASSKRS